MKRFACLLLAGLLALSAAGCQKAPAASSLPDSSAPEATPAPTAAPVWEDDFSALPEEVRGQFFAAQKLYHYFILKPPACKEETTSINGTAYRQVDDPAFGDFASFYRALGGCFTQDFIDGDLLADDLYMGWDDLLYTRLIPRDANVTFRRATAQVTEQTDTAIRFTVTAEYAEGETVSYKTVEYTALLENGVWLFDRFGGYL